MTRASCPPSDWRGQALERPQAIATIATASHQQPDRKGSWSRRVAAASSALRRWLEQTRTHLGSSGSVRFHAATISPLPPRLLKGSGDLQGDLLDVLSAATPPCSFPGHNLVRARAPKKRTISIGHGRVIQIGHGNHNHELFAPGPAPIPRRSDDVTARPPERARLGNQSLLDTAHQEQN